MHARNLDAVQLCPELKHDELSLVRTGRQIGHVFDALHASVIDLRDGILELGHDAAQLDDGFF